MIFGLGLLKEMSKRQFLESRPQGTGFKRNLIFQSIFL